MLINWTSAYMPEREELKTRLHTARNQLYEKWDAYEPAVNEMLQKTNTTFSHGTSVNCLIKNTPVLKL